MPLAAHGQNAGDPEWNHFGVDFQLGLNIKARFSNIGSTAGQPLPPPAVHADHTYSDGFVRLDSSGDRGGLTWNWGYQNASQVSGSGTLLMHAMSTDGATSAINDDPRLGMELNYARDLGQVASGRWGLKAAIGFTDVKIRDSQPLTGNVNLITDAYSLNGITPPQAPYAGSFSGPGPTIGDTPTRAVTTLSGGALITGSRQLDMWLYDFRFGPYLQMPLANRLSFQAGGGLAAGVAESTFSFADTTSISAANLQTKGIGNSNSTMVGFYGEAGLSFLVAPGVSIFGGGQFQYLGEFDQKLAGREAQLDLRHSVYFLAGVQLHF
jgi:hypothetical protein